MKIGDLVQIEQCIRATGHAMLHRPTIEGVVIKLAGTGAVDVLVPAPGGLIAVAFASDGWERSSSASIPALVAWRITAVLVAPPPVRPT